MFVIPLSGSVHVFGLIDSLKPFDSGPIHAVGQKPRLAVSTP